MSKENQRTLKWIWFSVAIITGYVIVILGTSVVWFILPAKGGLQDSTIWELIVGNLLIIAVGFLGGCIAEVISKMGNLSTSILISIFILTETALFLYDGNYNDPSWFVIFEALIIIMSVVFGNHFITRKRS